MKDNMKLIYLGAALVVVIGFCVFMYKRSNPDIQSAYNPANSGPPAYTKNGGNEAAYRAEMQKSQGRGAASGAAPDPYAGRYATPAPPGPARSTYGTPGGGTYTGGPR